MKWCRHCIETVGDRDTICPHCNRMLRALPPLNYDASTDTHHHESDPQLYEYYEREHRIEGEPRAD